MISAGIGVAVIGFGARYILRNAPNLGTKFSEAAKAMPKIDSNVC